MPFAFFAAVGLPGLSGFPGEFTMLVGIFQESTVAAAFAALGIVLGAWYMLNLFRTAFTGPLHRAENRTLPDLGRREAVILVPLVILMLLIGLLPGLVLRPTDAAVSSLLHTTEERSAVLQDNFPLAAIKDFPGITGGMTFTPDGDPKKCAVVVMINEDGQFAFHKSVCPK